MCKSTEIFRPCRTLSSRMWYSSICDIRLEPADT
nr:MAG TPA: hypothetical protein [Caudoviricetes sp.]